MSSRLSDDAEHEETNTQAYIHYSHSESKFSTSSVHASHSEEADMSNSLSETFTENATDTDFSENLRSKEARQRRLKQLTKEITWFFPVNMLRRFLHK